MSSDSRLSRALWGASLAMLANSSQAGINTWTVKGPPGGIFHDVRASSSDANVFYATYGSSVHGSTDGGVTWTTLRDFASQANTIAVDPTDGNRLYVAVIDDGLFRSDNRGQSFVQVAAPGSGMWGVGTNGATTYYAMQNQVYRSVDRGQSWSLMTPAMSPLAYTPSKFIVDPQNGDVVYTFGEPKAARSIDGGISWSEAEVNPGSSTTKIYDIARLSATQLIVAANDGLYISNDRGDTWTRTASGSFIAIAVDPSTPGRAVATSRTTAPLQLTTDYGATWTTFGNLPVLRFEGVSFAANTPSHIVILGQQGALYTNDNALNWTEAALSPAASHPTQFVTTAAANSKVYTYTANTGGGMFATSGDAGWQRLNLAAAQALNPSAEFGEASLAVKPGAPDSIFFGVFNRGVFRSADGGQSWTAPNTDLAGFASKVFAFDPQDANTMYVSVSKASSVPAAGIYRSADGGATWSAHSTNLASDLLSTDFQIDPADPTRMFLSVSQGNQPGSPGGLYRSTDRGLTWTQSFNGRDVNSMAIDPSNSARMYVATEVGLRVSNDGGNSFFSNTAFSAITNKSANNVVIDPVVPTTLYVASLDPYSPGVKESSWILRSVDAGDTWEVLRSASDAGGPWYVDQLALDPGHPSLIYAGTSLRGAATLEIAPDLRVEISDHSGTRPRGEESTFNLRAVNNGPYSATVVKLSATLPAGLTNVSITADRGTCASTTCTVPALRVGEAVNAVVRYTTPTAALFIPVTATVAAHENDAVASDNSAQASAVTGDAGDLGIAIASSTTSVTQGSNVTYTVTVTNHGSTASTEGTLDFRLGSGFTLSALPSGCTAATGGATCSLGTLAPGASQVFTFTAVATNTGSVEATANVTFGPTTADTNPADNVATSSVTATSAPSSGGNTGGGGRSGGGGGGAMNLATLLGGLLLLFVRRRSTRA
ncbi:CARDB domain-containing protein [Steroidobacter flavus]|uniref:CARDB domain-containing protein n=1 Tax=Steroidobacter flavus TaxID=1842136 RepID=A0ABV8T174_9GAMM